VPGLNFQKAIEDAKQLAYDKGLRGRAFKRFVNREVNKNLHKTGKFRGRININFQKDSPEKRSPEGPTYQVVFPDKREGASEDGEIES
jgi:hypothetical protein